MSEDFTTKVAWSALAAVFALTAAACVFIGLNLADPSDILEDFLATDAFSLVASMSFAFVGTLVATRQPRNSIGWIFLASGVVLAGSTLASQYAVYTLLTAPGAVPAGREVAWLANWLPLPATLLTAMLLLLLFPDGRLLSRRWRFAVGTAVLGTCLIAAGSAFTPGPLEEPWDFVVNPVGLEFLTGTARDTLGLGWLLAFLLMPASALSLILRFRRSRGIERQQLKWIAASGAYLAASWTFVTLTFYLSEIFLAIGLLLSGSAVVSIPVAAGVAILRYHLYDIDRIINRALVYAVLTAVLALLYFGLVVGLQALLLPLSGSSDFAIALTTLIVAALFLPVRRRVQAVVDRRFNRRAYDAVRTVEDFGARLRQQVDLDTLRYELLAVVDETMEPSRVTLWLREPAS